MKIAPRTETTPALAAAGWVRMVGARPHLAAEPAGTYAAAPPASRTAGWLDEIAALADRRDRDMGRLVALLATAQQADDLAEVCGGMSLQVWLEHQVRCTRVEARQVLGAAETLRRLPATLVGLADGWLSWSQTSAICKAARTVRVRLLADLDQLVADAMVAHRGWEPDALVADVWDWADRAQPSRLEKDEAAAQRDRFLTLSPRLFGGGSLYGELDPVGFATVAEALHAPTEPPPAVPDDLDDPDEAVDGVFDTLDERRRALTRQHGGALADRLVGLCEADLAGTAGTAGTPGGDGDAGDGGAGAGGAGGTGGTAGDGPDSGGAGAPGRAGRPLLLATIGLDALLDDTRTPGWLLHTLAGGRMKISAAALQQLIDARGADLRTIVLDNTGQAVGVGTTTHIPPRWLREAIWARDTAVRDPDGTCPVRRADLDHIDPWPDGPTDVDNLQPLGRTWHNAKTSKHWTVHRARDGTTVWTHRRHGWTLRQAPPRRDLARPPEVGPPRPPPPDRPPDDP